MSTKYKINAYPISQDIPITPSFWKKINTIVDDLQVWLDNKLSELSIEEIRDELTITSISHINGEDIDTIDSKLKSISEKHKGLCITMGPTQFQSFTYVRMSSKKNKCEVAFVIDAVM
jgi:hypothetical protein